MATVDLTRINSNIAALNSLNALREVNKNLALHQTRLATGRRINEAADDPAGLGLATKFDVRAKSLQQAIDNIGDAKNMLAVAEGGLNKINAILSKMRIKAEQAASETLGDTERATIAADLAQYAREIDDIVDQTTWNGLKLLNGTADFDFQTSADYDKYTTWVLSQSHDVQGSGTAGLGDLATVSGTSTVTQSESEDFTVETASVFDYLNELSSGTYTLKVYIGTITDHKATAYAQLIDANGNPVLVDADGSEGGLVDYKLTFEYDDQTEKEINFGVGVKVTLASGLAEGDQEEVTITYTKSGTYTVSLADAAAAREYMDKVDKAIATVSASLANIGAMMDRLSFKEDALAVGKINTEAAFNRIMNADMALEQLEAVKFSILQQTATAMLAQTNVAPQSVLQLFR